MAMYGECEIICHCVVCNLSLMSLIFGVELGAKSLKGGETLMNQQLPPTK